MSKNLKIIEGLTATTDFNGATLSIGDKVRSFHSPFYSSTDDTVWGIGLNPSDRDGYVEGILLDTGSVEIRGCRRYTIEVVKDVARGGFEYPDHIGQNVYPPLNGTRSTFGRCFGVVKVAA